MGIVVDAVSEVLDIPASDIEPPPEFGARIRTDFISGMGKINGKFVVLLDVNRILSIDEVAVVAALGQGNGGNERDNWNSRPTERNPAGHAGCKPPHHPSKPDFRRRVRPVPEADLQSRGISLSEREEGSGDRSADARGSITTDSTRSPHTTDTCAGGERARAADHGRSADDQQGTYFFREPKHFDFLRRVASRHRPGPAVPRLGAASSTGDRPIRT